MDNNADYIMRLNKLSQIIAEKEAEIENIRKIGTNKAGVDFNYVRDLRGSHLAYQREFNSILEQHPSLENHYSKIIIDTFRDFWLERKEYQVLEPVEIDLEKRLSQNSISRAAVKVGEDEQYEIYFIDGSLIRLEKCTQSTVYLGECRIATYLNNDNSRVIAAAVYMHWVYWYESGGIAGDGFIYRRSLDGQLIEKLDWISNEKTIDAMCHSVSDDKVHRMLLKSDSLIIDVFRSTQNATYQIVVHEDSGTLKVERLLPWETRTDIISASGDALQQQSNNQRTHLIDSDLVNNPFYVLEVAPTDTRATIISKAEEKAFFLEGNSCDEAQASLLNLSKRLSAEVDWFCGCNESIIANIRQSIKDKTEIRTNELTGLAKLNASLFNLTIATYDDFYELGYAILDIDEQYDNITPFELMKTINECHSKAGVLTVSEDEVERELEKKRERIRKLISAKTQTLSEEDYIEFITMLAEKCIADEDYEDGVVIADVIDQYELKMQSVIETATDGISSYLEQIKRIPNKKGIEAEVTKLIRRLKKWDKLVQPLQLKSMASGATHQESERIGYEMRDFCLWLHNEKEMTDVALLLTSELKKIFLEIGNLYDIFGRDLNELNRIAREDKETKDIIAKIEAIGETIERWKNPSIDFSMLATFTIRGTLDDDSDFITRIVNLNARIKAINADEEVIAQLRTALCITARGGAIYANNKGHSPQTALYITLMLLQEFGDIEELRTMLSKDISALKTTDAKSSHAKGWMLLLVLFGPFIAMFVAAMLNCL